MHANHAHAARGAHYSAVAAPRLQHWDNDSEQLLDKKFPTMTTGASSDIIDQIKEEQSKHHVAAAQNKHLGCTHGVFA